MTSQGGISLINTCEGRRGRRGVLYFRNLDKREEEEELAHYSFRILIKGTIKGKVCFTITYVSKRDVGGISYDKVNSN